MRNTFVRFFFTLLLLAGFLDVNAQWNTTTIADAGKNQESLRPQIARESNGTIHIIFAGNRTKKPDSNFEIFYTYGTSGSFVDPFPITEVGGDGVDVSSTRLAVNDATGAVHILFVNNNDSGLYHMLSSAPGSFSAPQLVREGASGPYFVGRPELVIADSGIAHVVWHEYQSPDVNDANIAYANSGDSFTLITDLSGNFALSNEVFPSIGIDSFGNLHVAFQASECAPDCPEPTSFREIYYINNIGGWSSAPTRLTFSPDMHDRGARLAIDSNDVIHVIFSTSEIDHREITYLENSSGDFVTMTAVFDAYDHELAVNAAGDAFIAYRDPSNMDLYVTDNRSGGFVSDLVSAQSGTFEADPDLIIDNTTVHITWNSLADRDKVLYANNGNAPPSPPAGTLHVEDIAMFTEPAKGNRWKAVADVLIHDDEGQPVSEASVSGSWSGLVSGSSTAITGSNGVATLKSPKTKKSGEIVFTVTNVTKDGFTYDPDANLETSDSVTGPPLVKFVSDGADFESPTNFALFGNFPNPFNPETTIRYQLPEQSQVTIEIYNFRGQLVRSLYKGYQTQGSHSVIWNGMDDTGQHVSSGVYLIQMTAGTFSASQKISLIR